MKTGLYQGTALKQEMKINPRLYQAMDLLYMPLLDLQQHLKQELLNNPFLEMAEEAEAEEVPEVKEEKKEDDEEIDWEEILLNGFEAGGRREEYEQREYYEPISVATRDRKSTRLNSSHVKISYAVFCLKKKKKKKTRVIQ